MAKRKPARASLSFPPVLLCFVCCAVVMAAAVYIVNRTGNTLRFGDAEAHLNIARRIVDSRTPGWGQVGTTWLPLPHLLIIPFVRIDSLWQSGLAGAIPSAFCMALAATFLFATVRRVLDTPAAIAATGVFLLNPNALYLGCIPMTESVFFACFFSLLYATVLFQATNSWFAIAGAGIAAFAGTWTRYEAWFLLPFAAVFLLAKAASNRWAKAVVFSALAGLGPALWLLHNWWYFADPIYFYRGPYSALAIQGGAHYPGQGDWFVAAKYFFTAAELVCGIPVLLLGTVGVFAALYRKAWWPVLVMLLPPVFYVWSIHSSGTPIHVPTLPPHSFYNTRYALALLPIAALGCAGLARVWKPLAWIAIVVSLIPFALHPATPPLTWQEADNNSRARLEWTRLAAAYLRANAAPHDTYLTVTGDATGIYRTNAIPLRKTLTGDMGIEYVLATARPDLFLHENWAVVTGGDQLQTLLDKARLKGPRYDLASRIYVKDGPVLEIYKLYEYPVHETSRRPQ